MTSSSQIASRIWRQHRRILLSQVRRNYRCMKRCADRNQTVGVRSLHAQLDPNLAAAGGSHDYRSTVIALAMGSAMTLGSLALQRSNEKSKDTCSSQQEQCQQQHQEQSADQQSQSHPLQASTTTTATAVHESTTRSTSNPLNPPLLTTTCEPQRTTAVPRNAMVNSRKSMRGRGLYDKYKVDWETVLGEGAYGTVHPARLATTGEKVALKRISKRFTNTSSFQTETDALFRIYDNGGHPNISGLRDMYDDHNYFYLILDLVSGGEMLDHLIENGAYSEADAARLMHEIASAISFLHGVGVIHADLKPENLLLSTKNRLDGSIKIIDFGCAVLEDVENPLSDPSQDFVGVNKKANSTGTSAYWPPERFNEGAFATRAMDMWSVGVILYIMLTGCHPFDIEGVAPDEETNRQIQECKGPPLDPKIVGHLSDSAIDLIKKLMDVDPEKRLSAYDMLHHPWVRGETAPTEKIVDSDKKLSRFRDLRDKLEAGVFAVLVNQAYPDSRLSEAKVARKLSEEPSVHILKRAFDAFDATGIGRVNAEDLTRITNQKTGSELTSGEMKEILESHGSSGEDDMSGIASTISLSQFSKLLRGLKRKHYPRGHYIFHAGEDGDAMYFINSGKVEVQTRKGQLVFTLRSGDFFGEGSLLEKENKRFTSAKCATPVDVIEISRDDFERYIGASIEARRDVAVRWRARSLQYAKNLLRLQTNVTSRKYRKGDVIYREGSKGKSMYRVDENGGILDVSNGGNVVHKYTAGDSFGESSLLFDRPRSSTVTCASKTCRLTEMKGEDFLALVESNPELAQSLRDMCRKRILKRAVKQYSLQKKRGLSNEDLVAVFHDADIDKTGSLSLDELRGLMHRIEPDFPMEEIKALLKYVDVDNDGQITLVEFQRLFRQFEDELSA